VMLAMQNSSTHSRTDSAAGTSAGIDDRFCTAGCYGRDAHSHHFHRLLTLALNVTTAAAAPHRWAVPIKPAQSGPHP
jgi:hypothetical protein